MKDIGLAIPSQHDYLPPLVPIPESRQEVVQIEKVENGFIVRVGCKYFVSQSFTEISSGLELYFKNPDEAAKKFLGNGK